jgi:hypothetical protein
LFIRLLTGNGSEHQRVAEPSAPAQRGHPGAAAAAAELERERKWEAAPGHTDGVTERDRATVGVEHLDGDAKFASRRDHDSSEGFVHLDDIEI